MDVKSNQQFANTVQGELIAGSPFFYNAVITVKMDFAVCTGYMLRKQIIAHLVYVKGQIENEQNSTIYCS